MSSFEEVNAWAQFPDKPDTKWAWDHVYVLRNKAWTHACRCGDAKLVYNRVLHRYFRRYAGTWGGSLMEYSKWADYYEQKVQVIIMRRIQQ